MNKLPRLPARASVLEGKYTAAQMHAYARKAEREGILKTKELLEKPERFHGEHQYLIGQMLGRT